MSNLIEYARKELTRAGYFGGEPIDIAMANNVIDLITVFSEGGHSGFSAGIARSLFHSLSNFEPIMQLNGDESEWNHIHKDMHNGDYDDLYQNNRCSHVFKEVTNGKEYVYDSEAIIFRDKDGSFVNRDSRKEIEFPYFPQKEYVDV